MYAAVFEIFHNLLKFCLHNNIRWTAVRGHSKYISHCKSVYSKFVTDIFRVHITLIAFTSQ
jgi:hypothetical protein